jgi:hypothetical protein
MAVAARRQPVLHTLIENSNNQLIKDASIFFLSNRF